ncbi:protein kinase [Pendulispora brunnea]|uniref:Protein kinase n=1 Tax=Pendulispora brunnea TaxID=2905690 RepID=A0ABZ2K6Q9_9BACT
MLIADRFVLEEEAGRGGMGVVHRAFDRTTGRRVALKVLRNTESSALRRFAREAEVLGKLEHPDIVRCIAHGEDENGEPYLALEWIDGESLLIRLTRAAAEEERLPVADVLELGQRLAGALDAAHAVGIVHRDVKPSNILLAGGSLRAPKLADFGIVRAKSGSDTPVEQATTTGTVLGTVGYMAPEQARGEADLDGRADLFSLGCVLFRCLTNRDAFAGTDPVAVISRLLMHKPPSVSEFRPDVPHELDTLVARLLAKERERRPASAAEVKRALARIDAALLGETQDSRTAPPPTKSRRPLWLAAIAMAVGILGAAIALRTRRPSPTPPVVGPVPVLLTDHKAAPSCVPQAAEAYARALRSMHEGRWDEAGRLFDQAWQADSACPQVAFRRFLSAYTQAPLYVQRERLRDAMRLRDALVVRDRLLLDALGMAVTQGHTDENVTHLLDELVRQYPNDAEVLVLSAVHGRMEAPRDSADLEAAVEGLRKATQIDPKYSDAWQMKGAALAKLGREDESDEAFAQCLRASPASVDCMAARIDGLQRHAKCADAAELARQKASWEPGESRPYEHLAEALVGAHAAREAIDEVLILRWNRLPPSSRDEVRLLETEQLEAWDGHFDVALRTAEQLAPYLANSADPEKRWANALLTVDALLETGNVARATQEAMMVLRRKDGWGPSPLHAFKMAAAEPWLLAAALRGGKLTVSEWRSATKAWERANEEAIGPFDRWVLAWGAAVGPSLAPAEAMAAAPTERSGKILRDFRSAWQEGIVDGYAGRIMMEAGDVTRAMPLLEAAARGCQGMRYPFFGVRIHLWLGMAKEKQGDTAGACSAYRTVLDRWGKATPRSVTAIEAEKRRRALACP